MGVQDHGNAVAHGQTRNHHLAPAARAAREVDVHDIDAALQLRPYRDETAEKREEFAAVSTFGHGRNVGRGDIPRQCRQQQSLDGRYAAADAQVGPDHQDAQRRRLRVGSGLLHAILRHRW